MPNALANEMSPYLRQHANNPVDWRPWGEAALAEAKRRDVPVLVSIGYSTCHWCHVMAHESFEDVPTATLMNELFVCIKVDREEHPEVDAIYMDTVQALTGHGGWPLNAFADHTGRPFYACTYLPTPNWQQLLRQLGAMWKEDRPRIAKAATEITAHLTRDEHAAGAIPDTVWDTLDRGLERTFDPEHPGYGYNAERAPKFPPNQLLSLLLASGRPAWVTQATAILEAMQDAGLHDRVGGGFHRYSVNRQWRLPHFEKMLYDNAQLIRSYARAGVQLDRVDFRRTAVNAGDYVLRDLRVSSGNTFLGYAAAEDADDPDGEGSFYAWSPDQLTTTLGATDAAPLINAWAVRPGTAEHNGHGHAEPVLSHIPHPRGADLNALALGGDVQALRTSWEPFLPKLRAVRDRRPRPGRDDKVLTDQNALALDAFAALGRFSGDNDRKRFTDACRELAQVLIARHEPTGLMRLAYPGQPGRPAFITDYGALVAGLLSAFDLLGDPELVHAAERVANEAVTRLRADDGGFYVTPAGRTDLVRRGREHTDNAVPAGQNLLALGLIRLWNLTGLARWRTVADGIFASAAGIATQAPSACATLLHAWMLAKRGQLTAVITGDATDPRTQELLAACRRSTLPGMAIVPVAACRTETWECLAERTAIREPQALICQGTVCLAPARDVAEVTARLSQAAGSLAPR